MEKHVVQISEEIITNVVKPVSLHTNDIEAGTIFTHIPLPKGTHYAIEKVDDVERFPTFKFSSSKGGVYKFTSYDLRNFSYDGKSFADYFVPKLGVAANLAVVFTVNRCEPLLYDEELVYPLYCYVGFDLFANERKAMPKGSRATDAMLAKLKESGIKPSMVDKYYRTLDIDKPIVFY
jgi:hypothetical protein